eukprot:TRINITY_DN263_c1_g2_i1.p1 TRINITY_DN263_c1_g2~~TRINITY_DN263_c1_g2_i1.p1  ORF type:complete len:277 (-),score=33.33 TRINITY_DN263_c1_g2_i1:83-913(-)
MGQIKSSFSPEHSIEREKYFFYCEYYSSQGDNESNEDNVCEVKINMECGDEKDDAKDQLNKGSFIGMFDGYNGTACTEHLQDNLMHDFLENQNFPKDIPRAFNESFKKCDEEFLKQIRDSDSQDTSNALTIFLWDDTLYVASVGSSYGYLLADKDPRPMTVRNDNCFGALGVKEPQGILHVLKNKVTANPFIEKFYIGPEVSFFIVGNANLWKNLKPNDIISTIQGKKELFETQKDIKESLYVTCVEIVTMASKRDSKSNITCMIGLFHHKSALFS